MTFKLPLAAGVNEPALVNANTNALVNSLFNNLNVGFIGISVTPGSNAADTSDDTLQSFVMPAGLLGVNGQSIRLRAWGVTANNANVKTLKVKFGVTPFNPISQALTTASVGPWMLECVITRLTATTQLAHGYVFDAAAILGTFQSTAGTETLANGLTLLLTGASGSSGAADITCNGAFVEFLS